MPTPPPTDTASADTTGQCRHHRQCRDHRPADTSGGTADTTGGAGGGEVQELSIAFVGPLTGGAANLGIYIRDGAKVAVEQFNEAHGDEFNITLEEFDTQGDPAQAPRCSTTTSATRTSSASSARPSPVSPRAVLPDLTEEAS